MESTRFTPTSVSTGRILARQHASLVGFPSRLGHSPDWIPLIPNPDERTGSVGTYSSAAADVRPIGSEPNGSISGEGLTHDLPGIRIPAQWLPLNRAEGKALNEFVQEEVVHNRYRERHDGSGSHQCLPEIDIAPDQFGEHAHTDRLL